MKKQSELKDDKYFEWLYSSKMRIKRRVLKMERVTAKRLSLLIDRSKPLQDQCLQSDLEWLLTWKLKTGCCPEFMWCDGVEIQEISIINKNYVILKALVWLGPESSDELFEVPMDGNMELKPTGKQFKSYRFNINYKGIELVAKKT